MVGLEASLSGFSSSLRLPLFLVCDGQVLTLRDSETSQRAGVELEAEQQQWFADNVSRANSDRKLAGCFSLLSHAESLPCFPYSACKALTEMCVKVGVWKAVVKDGLLVGLVSFIYAFLPWFFVFLPELVKIWIQLSFRAGLE